MRNYNQPTNFKEQMSLVSLINPIYCDKVEENKEILKKINQYEFDQNRHIKALRGSISYSKYGVIVQTQISRYFIPFQNIAGISNYISPIHKNSQ